MGLGGMRERGRGWERERIKRNRSKKVRKKGTSFRHLDNGLILSLSLSVRAGQSNHN